MMGAIKRILAGVLIATVAAVFCGKLAHAQGSRKDDLVLNAQGRPMAGASVRVCTASAMGQPCSPLASLFSDPGLTQALANPIATDGLGNYSFYATPGRYEIEISGPGITTKQLPNVILPNDPSSPTFATVTTTSGISAFSLSLTGNLTVSGSTAVTGALTVGGSPVPSTAQENQWGASQHFKGPNPWADITASGARAGTGGAFITQTTSGSPNVTLGSGANQFQNGDGVALQGVGAANTMSTPSAPTVTPSIASGPTGTEQDVNSPTGSSTYKYCYFAIDKNENVTACSATTTIANGLASLGLQTATLNTYSRSNDVATYNTTASTNLATNSYVDVIPNSPQFTGWYKVCSTPSGTQFTICGMSWDTRVGQNQLSDIGANTVSGGQVSWVQDNKVALTAVTGAWLYGVCAQRPGDSSFHLIGLTKPQGPGSLTDLQYDDYGVTYHGNQTFPSWLSDSNCTGAASTNGLLSTTIVSGGGTSSIVLANNANATVTTGTMSLDACPGIVAAANVAIQTGLTGPIYVPPAPNASRSYPIKSFCVIPTSGGGNVSIKMAGGLSLDQTLQFQGNTNIDGSFAQTGTPQFGNYAGASIGVNTVLPGIYFTGQGNYMQFMNISGTSQNADLLVVSDNANGLTLDTVNMVSAGQNSNDYLGLDMVNRDSSGTVVNLTLRNSLISGGPDQVTDKSWTPLVWQPVGSFYDSWTHNNNNRRGVHLTNNGSIDVRWYYSQGLINPQFTIFPSGNTTGRFETIYHDTDGQPTIANIGGVGPSLGNYSLKLVNQGSNPPNPIFSGNRPQAVFAEQTFYGNGFDVTPNRGVCKNGVWTTVAYPWETSGSYFAGNEAMMSCSEPIHIASGSAMFWDLAPPTNVTATVAAGGSVPASASGWVYSVSATGLDGGESILQPTPSAACVTSSGNQTCNVGYTGVTGASSYNIYRCNLSAGSCTSAALGGIIGLGSGWTRVALHTTGNPYSDTLASTTSVPALPSVTATGYPEITNQGMFSPKYQTLPVTFSTLASCSAAAEGTVQALSDSTTNTWGATISGGGTNHVLAYCDGTNWTVMAK